MQVALRGWMVKEVVSRVIVVSERRRKRVATVRGRSDEEEVSFLTSLATA
jgi:hypothetical protein